MSCLLRIGGDNAHLIMEQIASCPVGTADKVEAASREYSKTISGLDFNDPVQDAVWNAAEKHRDETINALGLGDRAWMLHSLLEDGFGNIRAHEYLRENGLRGEDSTGQTAEKKHIVSILNLQKRIHPRNVLGATDAEIFESDRRWNNAIGRAMILAERSAIKELYWC